MYALPDADEDVRLAQKYGGVLGLTSAAIRRGWAVRTVPALALAEVLKRLREALPLAA